jgi:hypothetical protein
MLPAHVPAQDWILAGFTAACALLPLLAELRVGRKHSTEPDNGVTHDSRDQDEEPPAEMIAA